MTRRRLPALGLVFLVLLGACGADAPAPTDSTAPLDPTRGARATPSPEPSASIGEVRPVPGSSSRLYPPNPGEVVVAVEAGHGGCLDWGVPDPEERGPEYSEKAITLSIARALAEQLTADGVRAMLVRDGDEALAGDHYPPLGCDGAPFRDVNGDGLAGFGPDLPEATRTRDELQARLDRANVAGADVLVSIHVDSITDAQGNLLPIARTETFYTDETPWGVPAAERLAAALQASVVTAMADAAGYDRQDRGTNAHNLYIVAPPLGDPTPERPDPARQPTRGALMPAVLVEVGTITLPAEHALLLSPSGVEAAARGLFEGLAAWFGERELAARLAPAGAEAGELPPVAADDGPPFRAGPLPEPPVRIEVTNTGTRGWEAGARIVGASVPTDEPYVYGVPDGAAPLGPELPALPPGASVVVELEPAELPGDGELAWFSLSVGAELLADHGSPALQLSSGAP